MAAIDNLRKLLETIPEEYTVTREFIRDLIETREQGPLESDDFIAGLIGAVVGLERRIVSGPRATETTGSESP